MCGVSQMCVCVMCVCVCVCVCVCYVCVRCVCVCVCVSWVLPVQCSVPYRTLPYHTVTMLTLPCVDQPRTLTSTSVHSSRCPLLFCSPARLSIRPSVRLAIHPSGWPLSIPSSYLSISQFIHLSIYLCHHSSVLVSLCTCMYVIIIIIIIIIMIMIILINGLLTRQS